MIHKLLVKHTYKNAWMEILPWSDIKPVKWEYISIGLNNGMAGCLLVKLNLQFNNTLNNR